ncbi:twin transmembrane helix small protein [Futiania mangrovi]|uniref:Twin transmembrane helix small protein n=1 Tax=Futiania mangrovi TaxID=2959716 RepID=A0A9J6PEQ3_9PROT|nr:twin transmembrane helix small protein [Futiania mangrovii]MCP1336312.1 twin transmembrane helix small protein [Futiania mangrovii]
MENLLHILIPVAMGATALMVLLGLVTLFRRGAENRSRSNKLMRMRVALQFAAILLIMAAIWLGGRGPTWFD